MDKKFRSRKILLSIAGSIFLVAALGLVVWGKSHAGDPTPASAPRSSGLDAQIADLEQKIADTPTVSRYISLSALYAQKARETADPSYYAKADGLMDLAAKLDPNNADVVATRAINQMGRHDFKAARAFGEQALAQNSSSAIYYGIVGDADIELGQYDDAVLNFQHMVDLKPNLASYNRIAYIRELYGDIPGAIEALQTAVIDGSTFSENIAYSYYELGKLYFRSDLNQAKIQFNNSLSLFPEYAPALEGLGKVAYAQGKPGEAEAFFQRALTSLPVAQYAIDLGELYQAEGDANRASQQYLLAKIAFEKAASGGVNADLEEAQFFGDHDLELPTALEKARAAYAERPSILGADTLAWALYKNGDYKNAAAYSKEALRLGENDPLIAFHAGMIAKANGQPAAAKKHLQVALQLSPNFSIIYVPVAKETLKTL